MPIPGIRGMEHVGITVPDINEACDFFTRILGAEVLFTAATDFRGEGDWMAEHLNVHPRPRSRNSAMCALAMAPILRSSSIPRRTRRPRGR